MKHLQKKYFNSLSGKITIYFSLGFTLLWLICNTFLFLEFKNTLWTNFDEQMESQARLIANKVNPNPKIVPLPQSDENFIILYEDQYNYLDTLFLPPQEIQDEIYSERNITIEEEDQDGGNIIVVYAKSSTEIEQTIKRLYVLFTTSLCLGFIFALILSSWISKKIISPINQLIKIADSTDLNNNTKLLNVPKSQDEIKELIIAFNRMLLRIKEQSELQNTFFASASHELRTPLSIMQGQLQVLLMSENIKGEAKEIYNDQLREVKRLIRIVNDFLLMSEIFDNKVVISKQEIDILDILSNILSNFKLKADNKNLKYRLSVQPLDASFSINSDYDKIYTICYNLLDNTLKYAQDNTVIKIDVTKKEDGLEIIIENEIRDEISPDISLVKQSFYHSKILNGEGSGLGLWIVNQLSELLNIQFDIFQIDNRFKVILFIK